MTIAVALAAITALSMPLAAGAAKGKKKAKKPGPVVTASQTVAVAGTGSIATAVATCPGKTKVVAGGFVETKPTGPSPTGAQGYLIESRRSGPKSWTVSSQYFDVAPAEAFSLTGFAYCRRNAPKISEASSIGTGTAYNQPSASNATCGGRKKAIGGGFLLPPPLVPNGPSQILLDSFRAGPKSWQTRVDHGSEFAGPLSSYTTFAYCVKTKKGPSDTAVAAAPNTAVRTPSTAFAGCSGGGRPVQGGFSQDPVDPGAGYFLIYESQRVGQGWQVSAQHAVSTNPNTLVAHCG